MADGVDITYGSSTVSGTSFAAPLVAGAIAELKDAFFTAYGRELSVKEALLLLQNTGDTMTGNVAYTEMNLSNALAAIQDTAELTLIGITV